MSAPQQSNPSRNHLRKPSAGPRFIAPALLIACSAIIVWAVWRGSRPAGSISSAPVQTDTNAASAEEPRPAFQKLVGKWVRPDGGYVIEIRSAGETGKLDAGYFNPSPINVGKAEASAQGSMMKVFIELRDVNYPGSTYTLAYDPATDQLKGIYYQALAQQSYEVFFERLK